jgi:hypothetical protein
MYSAGDGRAVAIEKDRLMFSNAFHARPAALQAAALAILVVGSCGQAARADGRLNAQYKITVAGIAIGKSEINVVIGSAEYTTSANGRASGVMRVLVSGEGTVSTRGAIVDGRLVPATFTSSTTRDDEKAEVKMTLDGGAVKDLSAQVSVTTEERVPVTEAHRKGIIDPLTALLVQVGGSGNVVAAEACQHTLPIFDGRRRYDLVLSFKRIDTVKADKGYAGPAVVCGVAFKPLAGHRPDSPLVKYLSGGRDIELTLAPITGTRVLAPFRLSIASMVGSMVVEATQFETMETASIRAALPATTTAQ